MVVGLATFALYWPSLGFEFVDFDDLTYVVHNELIGEGFSFAGAARLFTTSFEVNWIPVTLFSHMLDVELFGHDPTGHHGTSVVLHGLNAALLFACLRRMTGSRWASVFVAVAFAIHPLRVESVAWVSERKDVLSSFFGLLSILAYTSYAREGNAKFQQTRDYLISIVMLSLSLMAKPMFVTLPFLLLLIDGWPLRRMEGLTGEAADLPRFSRAPVSQLILEKLPMIVIVVVTSLWALSLQSGARADLESLPLLARLANAVLSYVTYPLATLWPQDLGIVYSHPYRPGTGGTAPSLPTLIVAGVAIAAACTVALRSIRQHPYRALGLFWYLGTLVPVIGIIQVGAQGHADRYSYFPMIGLTIWIAWEVRDRWQETEAMSPVIRLVAPALVASWLVAMAMTTRVQLDSWRNTRALFEQAVKASPGHAFLESLLAQQLEKDAEPDAAVAHYRKAIAADPSWIDLRVKLAHLLSRLERGAEAIREIESAIDRAPQRGELQMNLANFYIAGQQWNEAAVTLRRAAQLTPRSAQIRANLANVLLSMGDLSGAAAAFEETVLLDPKLTQAWYGWAMVLGRQANWVGAREKLERVLELDPSHSGAKEKIRQLRWLSELDS